MSPQQERLLLELLAIALYESCARAGAGCGIMAPWSYIPEGTRKYWRDKARFVTLPLPSPPQSPA